MISIQNGCRELVIRNVSCFLVHPVRNVFYYRVSFVETGKKAQTLALSNVVKVEPPRNANEEENAEAENEE